VSFLEQPVMSNKEKPVRRRRVDSIKAPKQEEEEEEEDTKADEVSNGTWYLLI